MKLYLRLLKFIKPHSGILMSAVIFMLLSAIFDSISLGMLVPLSDKVLGQGKIVFNRQLPVFISNIIDKINVTPPLVLLNSLVMIILAIFILKGIFFFSRTYLLTKLSQKVIRDIRDALYHKIQHFSLDYFTKSATGILVSRITYDVEVIKGAISVGLTDMVYQLLMVVLLSFIVFSINWKWALISISILPLVVFPIYHFGRVIKKISMQAQEKMGDLNRKLFETISGIKIVKAFSMENTEVAKVAQYNNSFFKIMMRLQKRAIVLGPFTEFIGACGGVLVLYYGGREVVKGHMSSGIFIFFLGVLLSMIKPCRRISEIHSINQQAIAALKRIVEVLDTPIKVKEAQNAGAMPLFNNEIIFENVNFAYDEKLVLDNVSLKVKKGDIIAIVGPSGAGKTTLINLIPRFYDVTAGAITIDGINIKDVTFKSLRKQFGLVTQDTFLFNDTVRNNISYGKENAGEEEILNAAKIAEAHDFIVTSAKGYDTVIGDMGIKLSGGQKQRIAIARAILNNPPILIFDEATSHLDAESTRLVQEALDRLLVNHTAFIIAHRLTTVKKATEIIVLEAGKIVERGTHDELLRKNGLYKKLFDLEFLVV